MLYLSAFEVVHLVDALLIWVCSCVDAINKFPLSCASFGGTLVWDSCLNVLCTTFLLSNIFLYLHSKVHFKLVASFCIICIYCIFFVVFLRSINFVDSCVNIMVVAGGIYLHV